MDNKKYFHLSMTQQDVLLIAISVRNKIEEFHTKYLSDEQMKELNPLIREGILEALVIKRKCIYDTNNPAWYRMWEYLIMMIPDYWEIPTETAIKKLAEKISQGKREKTRWQKRKEEK